MKPSVKPNSPTDKKCIEFNKATWNYSSLQNHQLQTQQKNFFDENIFYRHFTRFVDVAATDLPNVAQEFAQDVLLAFLRKVSFAL